MKCVGEGAGVDAALVAGTGGRPGADVVAAFFDGGGGALGGGGRGGEAGEAGEAGLGEGLVLVGPDGAAEDGQVVGFVNVDHVGGSAVGVLGRDGNRKGDVA